MRTITALSGPLTVKTLWGATLTLQSGETREVGDRMAVEACSQHPGLVVYADLSAEGGLADIAPPSDAEVREQGLVDAVAAAMSAPADGDLKQDGRPTLAALRKAGAPEDTTRAEAEVAFERWQASGGDGGQSG